MILRDKSLRKNVFARMGTPSLGRTKLTSRVLKRKSKLMLYYNDAIFNPKAPNTSFTLKNFVTLPAQTTMERKKTPIVKAIDKY